MKARFSLFSWVLALFCLPSTLWPLALLVSPKFSEHPLLTPTQIDLFSTLFWIYPFLLLTIAGLLHKLYQQHKTAAKALLALAFAGFYAVFFYIVGYI